MTRSWSRRTAGLGVACFSLALAACIGFSGYGDDDGEGAPGYAGYVGGYYEPWGYEYGGWGENYWVGPPRGRVAGGDRGYHDGYGRGRPMSDAGGRPRGGRRPVPSIPHRPRG